MALTGSLLRAQVLVHDPENDGMYVMLSSGQVLPFLVRRFYPQADGMRLKKPPLPVRGSWIAIAFMGGDIRSAYMIGAFHPNLVDSLPDLSTDPFSDYESNFNGSWSYTHGISGYHARQWADNSSFVMGSGSLNMPVVYRHIVTSGQVQQQIPYVQTDRNPNPQPPFGWNYSQATSGGSGGLSITTDPSGNFTITTTVTGKTFTVNWNSGSMTVDGSGNPTVTGTSQIVLSAPTIILSGMVKLGGSDAATPAAMEGTKDSAGDTLVSNFATKVVMK
jgi:hypothetical protein